MTTPLRRRRCAARFSRFLGWVAATGMLLAGATSQADELGGSLTLDGALERARAQSTAAASARASADAARGEARQAAAFPNPSSAEAAERAVEAQLDYEVTRAFALALAADSRAERARCAAEVFGVARTTSGERRREGDVSGYADRRLALEPARYRARQAAAMAACRKARLALVEPIASADEMLAWIEVELAPRIRQALPRSTKPGSAPWTRACRSARPSCGARWSGSRRS